MQEHAYRAHLEFLHKSLEKDVPPLPRLPLEDGQEHERLPAARALGASHQLGAFQVGQPHRLVCRGVEYAYVDALQCRGVGGGFKPLVNVCSQQ